MLKGYTSEIKKLFNFSKHHCKNVLVIQGCKDEVQSFIELMFPSFKTSRGSRDESEATLESEQGLRYVKKGNSLLNCYI